MSGVISFYLTSEMKHCGSYEKHNKIKKMIFWISIFESSLMNTLPTTNDKSSKTKKEDIYPWMNQDVSGEVKLSDFNCLPVYHNDQKNGLGSEPRLFLFPLLFFALKKFIYLLLGKLLHPFLSPSPLMDNMGIIRILILQIFKVSFNWKNTYKIFSTVLALGIHSPNITYHYYFTLLVILCRHK